MIRKLTIFGGIIALLFLAEALHSQCYNCDSNFPSGTFSTTSSSLTTVSDCMYGGEYAYFSVTSGQTYTWTTCGDSDFDTQLSLFSGASCGGTSLAYNDDDCGYQSTITWTATFTGTVTVLVSEYSCSSNSTCMTLQWSVGSGPAPPSGACENALPFCTSDSYIFPASTNVPDMGSVGCLYTTPNPAWYWMQIDQAGDIDIYISSGGDVDFIAWGPFNSLEDACATDLMSNSGVDCSYSTAATETANIDGAQPGEVYVLLITNYANVVTNISFSQTAGSGTTNCGIIAPPISNNGPLCEGETLQLSVSTPDASVSYSWTGPNGFTSSVMEPSIPNVTTAHAGTYSLVITDGADVSDPETTDVVVNPNVTPTFNAVGPYCYGSSIPALPNSSTNGITGSWSPAINNTATTTYTFTPTAGQCALTNTLTIDITPQETPTFNAVGPYCEGNTIPALSTTSTNGISGSWSPGINNTATTTYTFTPAAGECATTTTLTINITPQTVPTFDNVGPFCAGTTIPALPTTSTNGVSGTWSPAINNTATTTYTFTPTTGQCATTANLTIDITQPANPTFDPVGPFCAGENISALPTTSTNGIGGTWSPAINNTATTTYTFTPAAGECANEADLTITVNPNPIPSASNTGPVCAGASVNLNAEPNGMSNYSWSGPAGFSSSAQSPVIITDSTGIDDGIYTLLLTDSNGCTAEATTELTVHLNPTISTNISNPLCFESCDGEIEIDAQGAANPIEYFIDGSVSGQSNSVFLNLCAGNYSALIQDGNACVSNTIDIELINPELLELTIASIENQNCQTAGSAEVIANGGTSPYNYIWPSDASGVNQGYAGQLSAGNYEVTVIDANGCEEQISFEVENEGELVAESIIESHVSCRGASDGSIRVSVSVGTPDYTINWGANSEVVSSNTYLINNLSGGYYTITVTDNNGCSEIFNHQIDEPDKVLSANLTKENVSCYDANDGEIHTFPYGGVTPYTFEWSMDNVISHQSSLTGISEGFYHLEIHDANGCQYDTMVMIQEPSPILVDFEVTHPSCIGNNDGAIELSVTGGFEPYSYIWDNVNTSLSYLTRLYEGTIEISVLDSDGCSVDLGAITLIDVPEECLRIPDAFTPNSDDNNDTWVLENLDNFPNAVVTVFSRWGQIVYTGKQGEDPWDGTNIDGKKVATGSFLYLVKLYNGSTPISGIVTVVY
ncbi:MAG: gliding motility-associated C-terminal domain-containing protein [Bacteroidales bacterium]|jgi:gliding motility-associated-like protein|nr:gliding motility-associated C-terminal domain-containing protein [Bacteroidales bacterium]